MRLLNMDGTEVINKYEVPNPIDTRLGRLLVNAELIDLGDVQTILDCQNEHNLSFGDAAVLLGLVKETDIVRMLANQFEYPYLQSGDAGISDELIAAYIPFSKEVELFRKLRTQIKLRNVNEHRQAIAIVGINPGDGCSFIAANLATVFSQLGERTVIIDANLRNPRQHQIFNLSRRHGLADILAGRCGMEALVQIPELKNLSILPVGTIAPNPQELLSRPAFGTLIRELACNFDVVLIDTGSATFFADYQIVCSKAGSALLVCRKHKTRTHDFLTITEQLKNSKVNRIGAVLNEI
jgi:protein-tyrosine kinase